MDSGGLAGQWAVRDDFLEGRSGAGPRELAGGRKAQAWVWKQQGTFGRPQEATRPCRGEWWERKKADAEVRWLRAVNAKCKGLPSVLSVKAATRTPAQESGLMLSRGGGRPSTNVGGWAPA